MNRAPVVSRSSRGLASGDTVISHRSDWTVDQDWQSYSQEEHSTWRTLFQRQKNLLVGRACDEFVAGMLDLPMGADEIPDFRRLNDVLTRRTGWSIVAVPGLVPDEVFFDHLANRRFPAGRFIRRPSELDYLEEPDIFHDIFGHVPMLMNPVIADYIRAYGHGGLKALRLGLLDKLSRVYWYTVEFGLVQQKDGLRIYGAGIASSSAESIFALDSASPNRVNFKLARVMRTKYRIDDFQETYFVVDSFSHLLDLADVDFAPIYRAIDGETDFEPGHLLFGDQVLTHGSGNYHNVKKALQRNEFSR